MNRGFVLTLLLAAPTAAELAPATVCDLVAERATRRGREVDVVGTFMNVPKGWTMLANVPRRDKCGPTLPWTWPAALNLSIPPRANKSLENFLSLHSPEDQFPTVRIRGRFDSPRGAWKLDFQSLLGRTWGHTDIFGLAGTIYVSEIELKKAIWRPPTL